VWPTANQPPANNTWIRLDSWFDAAASVVCR